MYKRQKRRRKAGKKQQGGFIYSRHRRGRGILNLPPFKIIRAAKAIHDFSRQKGAINKAKFAYKMLK